MKILFAMMISLNCLSAFSTEVELSGQDNLHKLRVSEANAEFINRSMIMKVSAYVTFWNLCMANAAGKMVYAVDYSDRMLSVSLYSIPTGLACPQTPRSLPVTKKVTVEVINTESLPILVNGIVAK